MPHARDDDDDRAGLAPATLAALRRCGATRPRRWLVAVTLLLGVLAGVGVTAATPAGERTFAALADTVQSLMSVTVPFLGILLAHDLRRAPGTARLAPTMVAATLVAAAVGVFGVLVCAAALVLAPGGTAADTWRYAGTIALGSVLVQVVAQLVGVGLGLLLRSFVVAALASIVLPLGLYALLGVDALRPAQGWLTPYATVRNLLSRDMDAVRWAQWLVVLLLWGVGLNAVGAARLRRRPPVSPPAATQGTPERSPA
ncbi:hypothetical protein D7193_23870 [Micromonospora costi]|uniref:Uncharacterized protein n=2 Tax=Micromonospora costi TaxID=1530042 RepID=A0A3A9ZWX2_9ACTN|nr:hypothetical protein D7193_23870 [Micromonospora costi]